MLKLKHVSEIDFKETEPEYDEFHVELTEHIHQLVSSDVPYLTNLSGTKLMIFVSNPAITDCVERELGKGRYRITIEPIIPINETN